MLNKRVYKDIIPNRILIFVFPCDNLAIKMHGLLLFTIILLSDSTCLEKIKYISLYVPLSKTRSNQKFLRLNFEIHIRDIISK